MKRSLFLTLVSALLLAVLLLASCSAGKAEARDSYRTGDSGYDYSNSGGTGTGMPEYDYGDVYTEAIFDKDYSSPASDPGGEYARQVIRTFRIKSETREFDKVLGEISKYVEKHKGYFESSSVSDKSLNNRSAYYYRTASYTLRIPADSVDAFLSELGGLLNIVDSSSNLTDVSAEYYDLVSRISTLRAQREALEKMFAEATDIDYILKVEARLSDVIMQIEAYETSLNYYKSKIAYSTINITVDEVLTLTEVKPEGFGEEIARSFKESWQDFSEGCQDFAIGFVYAIPTLLTLAVFGIIIGFFIRALIRRGKRRRSSDDTK